MYGGQTNEYKSLTNDSEIGVYFIGDRHNHV
jgi:hypothetical protein